MACRGRYTRVIYAGLNLGRGDCRIICKIGGRCRRLFLPNYLLPFISSTFVPTESMPAGVRAFAENQPVTSIVETIRALLSGQPVGNDIWIALGWCIGIMIVAYIFAMRVYKKRV